MADGVGEGLADEVDAGHTMDARDREDELRLIRSRLKRTGDVTRLLLEREHAATREANAAHERTDGARDPPPRAPERHNHAV